MRKVEVEKELERRFGCKNIEKALDEADKDAEINKKRYTHDEIFKEAREIINGIK